MLLLGEVSNGEVANRALFFTVFGFSVKQHWELLSFQYAAFLSEMPHTVAIHA
ncbi:Uncharacterised protein [Vibrio cholerae]|nr:Uncharacterised protein [Vibrio cholerae]